MSEGTTAKAFVVGDTVTVRGEVLGVHEYPLGSGETELWVRLPSGARRTLSLRDAEKLLPDAPAPAQAVAALKRCEDLFYQGVGGRSAVSLVEFQDNAATVLAALRAAQPQQDQEKVRKAWEALDDLAPHRDVGEYAREYEAVAAALPPEPRGEADA